jgi:hypothetical protein
LMGSEGKTPLTTSLRLARDTTTKSRFLCPPL